jgi:hypothetical protein
MSIQQLGLRKRRAAGRRCGLTCGGQPLVPIIWSLEIGLDDVVTKT